MAAIHTSILRGKKHVELSLSFHLGKASQEARDWSHFGAGEQGGGGDGEALVTKPPDD